jgi:DNA-binding NarL/FixJ family response regulator
MVNVLVADDQKTFRDDAKAILAKEKGFRILEAANPDEAIERLRSDNIDVAIIDHRLRGADETDESGLRVAELSNPRIPIIMVSQYSDRKQILAAINTRPDGYPLIVRFLDKGEILKDGDLLLSTVHTALKKRELVAKGERERVHPELLKHYKSDRKWSNASQGLHYLTSLAFVILMIHASLSVGAQLVPLLFATIAILAGEVTTIVVSQREGSIGRRADKNHDEILQAVRFSQLLDACSSISEIEERDNARSRLIQIAASNWLAGENRTTSLSVPLDTKGHSLN